MSSAFSGNTYVSDPALLPLAAFVEEHASEIVQRAERAWESTILLFTQLSEPQRELIRKLARQTVAIWAIRLRQDPGYARGVYELGTEWGEQASRWELHVYSFTKAIHLLAVATWEYLAEVYPLDHLSPATVFFLGRSRDQVIDDIQIPLMSTYLQQREDELEHTRFSLQGRLSLPGQSLLQELGNRLNANKDRVVPAWITSVQEIEESTPAMLELLNHRAGVLVDLLLSLLASPTPETSAASLSNVRAIGLESAQQGVSFQEMFHALQQLRPILWDTVYEIYRREQYWHPAEFIEVLARLHMLLDLFSEGIGQAYLQQKEMIIQEQAEALHRRDLNLARDMLEGLLPKRTLCIPYTDVGAAWIPAREIGGDFYDVFELDDGDFIFLIGDVSGKGISAALLVSMVKYIIKANAPMYRSPAELLTVANRLIVQDLGPELFVTMFTVRYTPSSGKIVYTSAGHDTCFICRGSQQARNISLPSQGPVLGVFPEVELSDLSYKLEPGDMLLLYTDGLVNIRCGGKQSISALRLCPPLRRHAQLPTQEIVQHLLDEVVNGCETTDDITILLVKHEGGQVPSG
ncbi:MAG: PP2C family protein-serine/threonine phosphatase [Armatimonadota bacterium]